MANNDNVAEDFFDSLDNIHTDISGETVVLAEVSKDLPNEPAPHVQLLINNGLAKNFRIDRTVSQHLALIEVIEPRYTYYIYRHMGRLNKSNYIELLDELTQSAPINPDASYTASIGVERGRFLYLNWDSGRLLIHDLGNKVSSQRKKLVLTLLSEPKLFESRELRDIHLIKPSSKGFKDMLTTSFLAGKLKSAFMFSSSKTNVGIRPYAILDGNQLIAIIREQLIRIERTNKPHFRALISKIDKI